MKLFSKRKSSKTRVELFMEHLDFITEAEPELYNHSENPPGITSIIYNNLPDEGMITGITYGLSLANHESWVKGRPELMISVKSDDFSWAFAVALIADKLKGDCPFTCGQTINFGTQISEESEIDAFLIFAPSVLDRAHFLNIDVGDKLPIHIAGVYPIYSSEIELIEKWGLEEFWHHPDFDMYNVNRKRIVG